MNAITFALSGHSAPTEQPQEPQTPPAENTTAEAENAENETLTQPEA